MQRQTGRGKWTKNLKQSRAVFLFFSHLCIKMMILTRQARDKLGKVEKKVVCVRTGIERGAEEAQKALLKMASSKGALLACSLACVRALQLYLALIECFPYACPDDQVLSRRSSTRRTRRQHGWRVAS
jgi:hypothetical protein